MGDSAIEWCDKTWSPLVGCSHVSAGCDGCYAARDALGRLSTNPVYAGLAHRRAPDELPRFTGEVRLLDEGNPWGRNRLDDPLHWRKPCRVFVNSMSDLFHEDVPDLFVAQVFDVMARCPQHTFQVLTKRARRMADLLSQPGVRVHVTDRQGWRGEEPAWPLPNVWLGTSIEDQRYANIRIPNLVRAPAAVRFLSVEPLLGPVDIEPWLRWTGTHLNTCNVPNAGACFYPTCECACHGVGPLVDWVIVGGESGPGARPMHPQWVRSIRDQCSTARVPWLFKQWGEWAPTSCPISVDCAGQGDIVYFEDGSRWTDGDLEGCQRWWSWEGDDSAREHVWPNGSTSVRVGKKTAGRLLEGRTWDEYPS